MDKIITINGKKYLDADGAVFLIKSSEELEEIVRQQRNYASHRVVVNDAKKKLKGIFKK